LKELLAEDPFAMPAEPLFSETGAHIGFDFHGEEHLYPYFSKLFSIDWDHFWNHFTLDAALTDLKTTLAKFDVSIGFVKCVGLSKKKESVTSET
jgi:hypothetical protein